MSNDTNIIKHEEQLFSDVCGIINNARNRIATYANIEVCLTNWYVGKRIKEDVLYNRRAEYGKQVIKNLSVRLTSAYGNGWGDKNLRHCLRAAETFSEDEIVYATSRQLTWTHIRALMYVKDEPTQQKTPFGEVVKGNSHSEGTLYRTS